VSKNDRENRKKRKKQARDQRQEQRRPTGQMHKGNETAGGDRNVRGQASYPQPPAGHVALAAETKRPKRPVTPPFQSLSDVPPWLERAMNVAAARLCENHGIVTPIVEIDGKHQLLIPTGCDREEFVRSCGERFAQSVAAGTYLTAGDQLCLYHIVNGVDYQAACTITRTAGTITPGEWHASICEGETTLPSKDEFAQRVMAIIRRGGNTLPMEYDPVNFLVIQPRRMCLDLANAYDEYVTAILSRREAVLGNWSRVWLSGQRLMPPAYSDARHDVLPIVRQRSYYSGERIEALPYCLLGEHHAVNLVYDWPEMMVDIPADVLDAWEGSFDEVLSVAIDNLRRLSFPPQFAQHRGGFYVSYYNDDYDLSRLLLPEVFAALPCDGDPVVLAASRSTLLVCGVNNVSGLTAMANLALAIADKPRFRSGIPLRLADGSWQTYAPLADHPAASAFRWLRNWSLARDYAQQEGALMKFNPDIAEGPHVAEFFQMEEPRSGEEFSVSVWADGQVALLPKTDYIAFMKRNSDDRTMTHDAASQRAGRIVVPWDSAVRVIGHMKPLDMYPLRYLVEEFPNAEQLAVLESKYNIWPTKATTPRELENPMGQPMESEE